MNYQQIVDDINRSAYATQDVIDWYADLDLIFKPEAAILKKIDTVVRDKKILDIGIGGGRTTKFLIELSRDYAGIDYTPRSVEVARKKYPAANILGCDVRDMRVFDDHSFDFAFFSLNGIDSINHE